MATIAPTITSLPRSVHLVVWSNVTNADTCSAAELSGDGDRSVQIAGTFDSATVVVAGSNDGSNYIVLTDPQGNAISKTAAAIEAITEVTRYIKPTFSGGAGTQSLTVSMLFRGR